MAEGTKIAELPAVVTPDDTDLFETSQSSVSKKATRAQIRDGLSADGHTHMLSEVTDAGALAALDTVGGSEIDADAVDSVHYAAGSIDNEHLAADSVDSDQYVDGSIDTAHLADDAVTAPKTAPNVGVFSVDVDETDYSVTPFTPGDLWGVEVRLTDVSAALVELAEGLSSDPPAYFSLVADGATSIAISRVDDSAVSINGVAANGVQWTVPALGKVKVEVVEPNTFTIEGATTGAQTVPGAFTVGGALTAEAAATFEAAVTFEDDVVLEASSSGGGLVNSTTGGTLAVSLSGTYITSNAVFTIPTTAIGNGWFHCLWEVGADTHDPTFNSITLDISAEGFTAGEIYSVIVKSATAIRIQGPAGTFTEADFA